MTTPSYLLLAAALYLGALFLVAWLVDRRAVQRRRGPSTRSAALVYALSLGVYCSSWTYYGAVGSHSASPWSHAPIYLGPVLVLLLGWPLVRRLVAQGPQHRVTSIADYLGARFGKRQSLSILVALVAMAAVLPYVALQFRALAQAWAVVTGGADDSPVAALDTTLVIAMALAAFSILFGARRMDGRERHRGMMAAVAVESVVKLFAFFCVALAALLYLRQPGLAPISEALRPPPTAPVVTLDFLASTLVSGCAILCLPRQFHALVVEAPGSREAVPARWLLIAYLLLFMFLAVPISLAGAQLSAGLGASAVPPDSYVQWFPVARDQGWLVLLAFIGGISAATSMVIVGTVSLAIMLTNEIAVPLMLRGGASGSPALFALGNRLRLVRQVTIVLILFAAWLVSLRLGDIAWLTEIGFMSFLAAAQLAPGLVAGLYWRRAHGAAVMTGIVAGLACWIYALVLPATLEPGHALLTDGPLGLELLRPNALFGWQGSTLLGQATVASLGLNTALMVVLSLLLRPSSADLRQAALYLEASQAGASHGDDFDLSPVRAGQLSALLPPLLDGSRLRQLWQSFEERYQQRILPSDRLPLFALREAEAELAGVIGAASAGRVIRKLTDSRQLDFADLASLVSAAGRQHTFNRALLETTIESMLHGVAVVDAKLRLVAWNSRYEELFAYPERMLYVGLPVARLYRFNAERGVMAVGKRSIDEEVEKRLAWLRKGLPHRFERRLPDGRVIDIHGLPMPGGGIVTTYTDITEYREMLTELEEARAELESRIETGSRSLSDVNAELRRENRLRAEAEAKLREAAVSKSRFMSATSHDLLQPINAARLFAASLRQSVTLADGDSVTVDRIDSALSRAEELISELREVARLDSGRRQPENAPFAADALLRELYAEFLPEARSRGLRLRVRSSSLWLHSDRQLLTRALQNLLGNALKYSRQGTVLLGARRRGDRLEIQVMDQGPGVPEEHQARIFQEFERLSSASDGHGEGLGLGLAIVKRYAALLDLPLRFVSEPGRGSVFSLAIPLGEPQQAPSESEIQGGMAGRLAGLQVLCVDNDAQVREALAAILTAEGCRVTVVADRRGLRDALAVQRPDVVLADYHLDEEIGREHV